MVRIKRRHSKMEERSEGSTGSLCEDFGLMMRKTREWTEEMLIRVNFMRDLTVEDEAHARGQVQKISEMLEKTPASRCKDFHDVLKKMENIIENKLRSVEKLKHLLGEVDEKLAAVEKELSLKQEKYSKELLELNNAENNVRLAYSSYKKLSDALPTSEDLSQDHSSLRSSRRYKKKVATLGRKEEERRKSVKEADTKQKSLDEMKYETTDEFIKLVTCVEGGFERLLASFLEEHANSVEDSVRLCRASDGNKKGSGPMLLVELQNFKKSCGNYLAKEALLMHQVTMLFNRIEMDGLETEGVYRISGSEVKCNKLLDALENDPNDCDEDVHNASIHTVANSAKKLLLKNPQLMFTTEVKNGMLEVLHGMPHDHSADPVPTEVLEKLVPILKMLPDNNGTLIMRVLRHLNKVASKSEMNKMDVDNLAMTFMPALINDSLDSSMKSKPDTWIKILVLLINNWEFLFGMASSTAGSVDHVDSSCSDPASPTNGSGSVFPSTGSESASPTTNSDSVFCI